MLHKAYWGGGKCFQVANSGFFLGGIRPQYVKHSMLCLRFMYWGRMPPPPSPSGMDVASLILSCASHNFCGNVLRYHKSCGIPNTMQSVVTTSVAWYTAFLSFMDIKDKDRIKALASSLLLLLKVVRLCFYAPGYAIGNFCDKSCQCPQDSCYTFWVPFCLLCSWGAYAPQYAQHNKRQRYPILCGS